MSLKDEVEENKRSEIGINCTSLLFYEFADIECSQEEIDYTGDLRAANRLSSSRFVCE